MVSDKRLRQEVNRFAVISGFVALVFVAGCRSRPAAAPKYSDDHHQRAAIEERAAQFFNDAVLLKPRENIPAADLAFALAPLLIQEVAGREPASSSGPDTIYYQLGAVDLAGITRPQMTYLWRCESGKTSALGVRMTLDARGLPVIWEVLDDQPGPQVVFVSQSLEDKAKTAGASPAPDRRFAVEQPLDVAPDVVVARVIDDGPVAMGPIVHVTAEPCGISTVICRCMPTQARQLVATKYYELEPMSELAKEVVPLLGANRNVLEKLRLPLGF